MSLSLRCFWAQRSTVSAEGKPCPACGATLPACTSPSGWLGHCCSGTSVGVLLEGAGEQGGRCVCGALFIFNSSAERALAAANVRSSRWICAKNFIVLLLRQAAATVCLLPATRLVRHFVRAKYDTDLD